MQLVFKIALKLKKKISTFFNEERISNLLVDAHGCMYSPEIVLICIKSAFSYLSYTKLNENFEILTLPHQYSITKFLSTINVSPDNEHKNNAYIKHKINHLSGEEKKISLMVDEIYIKLKPEF